MIHYYFSLLNESMVMLANDVWINAQSVRPTCSHVSEGYAKGRHAEIAVTDVFRAKRQRSESGYRRNGRRLWREGSWLADAIVGGGGARARPPVFPRTMPNGAFVKVSSFTADAGAAAAARRAPPPGSDNRLRRSDRRSTEVVRLFHRPLPPPPLSPPRFQDNTH